jgi:hypothetical protein
MEAAVGISLTQRCAPPSVEKKRQRECRNPVKVPTYRQFAFEGPQLRLVESIHQVGLVTALCLSRVRTQRPV